MSALMLDLSVLTSLHYLLNKLLQVLLHIFVPRHVQKYFQSDLHLINHISNPDTTHYIPRRFLLTLSTDSEKSQLHEFPLLKRTLQLTGLALSTFRLLPRISHQSPRILT